MYISLEESLPTSKKVKLSFEYPDTVFLRSSLMRKIALLIIGLAFTFGAVCMVLSGEQGGWFALIFFSTMSVLGFLQCLPRAGGLVLMPQGFAARSLFKTRFYPWAEVHNFGVFTTRHIRRVGFDTSGASHNTSTKLAAAFVGFGNALPDNYGLQPEDLAVILTRYRSAALQGLECMPKEEVPEIF